MANHEGCALRGIADGVDGETDITQGEVVQVEAVGSWHPFVVIGQSACTPFHFPYLIGLAPKVDVGLSGYGTSHLDANIECVAWQMQVDGGVVDAQGIDLDLPSDV